MTKAQIRAELRRSALNDDWPWGTLHQDCFTPLWRDWRCDGESVYFIATQRPQDMRVFMLLVAEAI